MHSILPQYPPFNLQKPKKLANVVSESPACMLDSADLRALFSQHEPIEVEIGSGKGTFLVARAAVRPEVNFLGIEWARGYYRYAADRAMRHNLVNVHMVRADAAQLFAEAIPPSSLLRVHIYFPDPWPKRCHHGRRLICPVFLELVHKALILGGQLLIVTDHLDYFAWIKHALAEVRSFLAVPFPKMTDKTGELVGTNFERKYIASGRPLHKVARMRYL